MSDVSDDLPLTAPLARGRPRSTTHAEMAKVALDLFARNGFEATTVEDIAATIHVGRRTLFRYFPSKNDIVWGDFDLVLQRLRHHLDESTPDEPVMQAIARSVVASNSYPDDELPDLRIRIRLITSVPALQGHSMVRYAEWREVVAEYAAERLGLAPGDLVPTVIAHAVLATSMAAFVSWVTGAEDDLATSLRRAFELLGDGFADV